MSMPQGQRSRPTYEFKTKIGAKITVYLTFLTKKEAIDISTIKLERIGAIGFRYYWR